MADVILSVDVQSDADGFNDIQRELREVGGQSERTFQSIEQRSNDARREQIRLREEITRLGGQIANNNRIASQADQPTRTRLAASNRAIRVEQSLLRVQQQRNSGVLAGLANENRELNQVTAATRRLERANRGASDSTRGFSGSASGLKDILASIGIEQVAFQVIQFGRNAIEASATLEGFERGLRLVEGTNAPERLEELIEVANLPGLNLDSLINYSNRLRAIGLTAEETDAILENTGKTIVAFGGTAETGAQAVEQIVQAISTNTVSLQDFRSIAQRIPGFYQQIAETHGVAASIDGFRDAVDAAGGSVKDALIPVLEALGEEFGQVPAESYVVSLDGLQNAFFLLQAEIGDQFLPIIAEAARGLSEFFDAIRTNDLDDLPEPIRQIVEGAQSLYQGFINVAESIRRGLGPELDLLLPAIGSLLGSILDLAGSLLTALAPAYEILVLPTRIAIALIVNLAETISTVIVAITDFVDWVSGAAAAEEMLAASTERAITTVDGLTEATKRATAEAQRKAQMTRNATAAEEDATAAGDRQARQLSVTQGALLNVNRELREKRARLETLAETITSTAHPAYVQLERQVKVLEGSSADLSGQVSTLNAEITQVEAPTNTATQAAARLTSGTNELRVAIAALPPEITAVRVNLERLTPFTDAINQQFQDMELSLVDTTAETQVFNQVFRELQTVLTSVAADQAIATAEFRLVNPAVSDAVDSMLAYAGELDNVEGGLVDVETISENVRRALGSQGDAFGDLRDEVDAADISLDDIDDTMDDIGRTIEDDLIDSVTSLDLAFEELGNNIPGFLADTLALLGEVNEELAGVADSVNNLVGAAASGNPIAFLAEIPGLARELNALQTDESLTTSARADRVFGVISQIEDSDLSPQQQQQLIGPLQEYIRELLTRSILSTTEAFAPALTLQHEAFAGTRGLDFNFDQSREDLGLGDTGFQTAFNISELDLTPVITQLEAVGEILEILNQDITAVDSGPPLSMLLSTVTDLVNMFFGSPGQDVFADIREPVEAAQQTLEEAIASGVGVDDALQGFITANDTYYDGIIDIIRIVGEATGQNISGLIGPLLAEQGEVDNRARRLSAGTPGYTGSIAEPLAEPVAEVVEEVVEEVIEEVVAAVQDAVVEAVQDPFDGSVPPEMIAEPVAEVVEEVVAAVQDAVVEAVDTTTGSIPPEVVAEPVAEAVEEVVTAVQDAVVDTVAEVMESTPAETIAAPVAEVVEEIIEEVVTAVADAVAPISNTTFTRQTPITPFTQAQGGTAPDTPDTVAETVAEAVAEVLAPITDAIAPIRDVLTPIIRQVGGTAPDTPQVLTPETVAPIAEMIAEPIAEAVAEAVADVIEETAETQPRDTSLLRNAVQRSQFELGGATGESDFESRRGTLITAINAFYDAELERIAEVADSEEELRNLREDSTLHRDQLLQRATTATNRFAEERIRQEKRVAQEAERTAETAERAATNASETQQRLVEEAIRLSEEEAEAEREAIEDAAEAAADLARRRYDIQVDLGRDITEIEQELAREIEMIGVDLARDLLDIQIQLMRDEIEIREDAARDIREINVDLAREQEDIARDLSDELEGIEADRLSSIQDRNIEHQQTLVDISRGASEDIQDIEIDLQRRIEDIERGLERDLASLSGTRRQRGERGVELRERAEQAIEDAGIRAGRRRADVGLGVQRDRNEERLDRQRDLTEIGSETEQDRENALLESQREAQSAFIEASQDREDARQSERDDTTDARLEARQDVEDERQQSQFELDDVHLGALQGLIDTAEMARQDNADLHQQTLFENEIVHTATLADNEALRVTMLYDSLTTALLAKVNSAISSLRAAQAVAGSPQQSQMVNLRIENVIPLGTNDVVKSVTNRTVQLVDQGRALRP